MVLLLTLTLFLHVQEGLCHNPSDSIGVEKKGSKNFILHKVDSKETLYSISRKYSVTVAQLQQSNAEIKTGISVGQIIRIPYKLPSIKSAVLSSKTHIVAPKETLFSISKKYKVSIEELKRANPGISMGLKKGQELIIPSKENVKEQSNKIKNEAVAKKTETKEEAKEDSQPVKEQKEPEGEDQSGH